MRGVMCGIGAAACLAVAPLQSWAQDTVVPVPLDTARPETAVVARAEPTADQLKYLRGLRTVARGIAQLRSGVDGVARAEGSKDTLRMRRAGRMLAGLCGSARTFMRDGRSTMKADVYEDSARVKARRLVLQIDSLIKATPTCDTAAAKRPTRAAADVLGRLRSYETALLEFRTIVAAPSATPIAPQQ